MRKKQHPTLFMETTKIEPTQTVSEIQKTLGQYGASQILTEYASGEVTGISFKIIVKGSDLPFRLPCRYESIMEVLISRKKRVQARTDIRGQAKRVAWRQILRWVEAQLALTTTKMVSIEEVFLPYLQGKDGKTLYESLSENKFKMLT